MVSGNRKLLQAGGIDANLLDNLSDFLSAVNTVSPVVEYVPA